MTKQNQIASTLTLTLALIACSQLTACGDDGSGEGQGESETGEGQGFALAGVHTDEWGDSHTITDESWTNAAGSFAIAEYDNEAMWAVAQNADTNEYFPGLWSRFDWTYDGETLYYCQSVYDGATIDDAKAGSADAADLTMGCSGFAWTRLD